MTEIGGFCSWLCSLQIAYVKFVTGCIVCFSLNFKTLEFPNVLYKFPILLSVIISITIIIYVLLNSICTYMILYQ